MVRIVEKPPVLEAKYFEGGLDNAMEIIEWAEESGICREAPLYSPPRAEGAGERLIFHPAYVKGADRVILPSGRWAVWDGRELVVYRPDEFEQTFTVIDRGE
jgi:hypothetical protein